MFARKSNSSSPSALTRSSPRRCRNSSRAPHRPPRRNLLLRRVRQVVEVNLLPVAVDPGRDEAEAVEARPGGFVARLQIECDGRVVELDDDPSAAVRAGRVIRKAPVVVPAVRKDMRTVVAPRVCFTAFRAVGRVEEKALAARPLDRHAEKAPREAR